MADAVSELRREVHKRGYDTKKTEGHHWGVFHPDGEPVRTKKGTPLEIVASDDQRSMKNNVSNLRDAGVLPRPKEVKTKLREKKLGRVRLKQYSDVLRDEVVKAMKEYDLTQADVSHYADLLAKEEGRHYPTFGQGVISKFLKGTSFGEENYRWMTAAISAIKAANGDIPDAAQSRTRMTASAPQPEEREPKGIEVEGESKVKRKATIPTLAFEAQMWIYRDDKDHDAITILIEAIARLELDS